MTHSYIRLINQWESIVTILMFVVLKIKLSVVVVLFELNDLLCSRNCVVFENCRRHALYVFFLLLWRAFRCWMRIANQIVREKILEYGYGMLSIMFRNRKLVLVKYCSPWLFIEKYFENSHTIFTDYPFTLIENHSRKF